MAEMSDFMGKIVSLTTQYQSDMLDVAKEQGAKLQTLQKAVDEGAAQFEAQGMQLEVQAAELKALKKKMQNFETAQAEASKKSSEQFKALEQKLMTRTSPSSSSAALTTNNQPTTARPGGPAPVTTKTQPPMDKGFLVHKSKPQDSDYVVRLDVCEWPEDQGTRHPERVHLPFGELPNTIKDIVHKQEDLYLRGTKEGVAGPDWWEDIQYAPKCKSSTTKCMRAHFNTYGTTLWTKEHPRCFACLTCTNKQMPCVIWDHDNQLFWLLPVVKAARRKGAGYRTKDYYIAAEQEFSKKNPPQRDIWDAEKGGAGATSGAGAKRK